MSSDPCPPLPTPAGPRSAGEPLPTPAHPPKGGGWEGVAGRGQPINAHDVAASPSDARALLAAWQRRPDVVTIDRTTLRDLVRIARRGVRHQGDVDVVDAALFISRTEGGR